MLEVLGFIVLLILISPFILAFAVIVLAAVVLAFILTCVLGLLTAVFDP